MAVGIMLTNGIVLGFEWSMKHKIVQIHLSFFSFVVLWGLNEEDFEDEGTE
jgi:hypothetical protein